MTGPLLFLVFLAVSILGVYYVAMRGYSRAGAVQLPKRAEPIDYEHAQRLYLGYQELIAAGLAEPKDSPPAVLTCPVCGVHAFEIDPPPANHTGLHGPNGVEGITCDVRTIRPGQVATKIIPGTFTYRPITRITPLEDWIARHEPHLRPRAEAPGREGASE